jgi:hypothetical protein
MGVTLHDLLQFGPSWGDPLPLVAIYHRQGDYPYLVLAFPEGLSHPQHGGLQNVDLVDQSRVHRDDAVGQDVSLDVIVEGFPAFLCELLRVIDLLKHRMRIDGLWVQDHTGCSYRTSPSTTTGLIKTGPQGFSFV